MEEAITPEAINNVKYLPNRVFINLLSANPTKWSNTFKQFVRKLPTNCLSVFDHLVKLTPKGLMKVKPQLNWQLPSMRVQKVKIKWYHVQKTVLTTNHMWFIIKIPCKTYFCCQGDFLWREIYNTWRDI